MLGGIRKTRKNFIVTARPPSEAHRHGGHHGVHDRPSMHAHGDALFGAAMGREGSSRGRGGAFQHAVADLRGNHAHEAGGSRDSSVHGGNHHGGSSSIAQALDRQASLAAALSTATANGPRPRGVRGFRRATLRARSPPLFSWSVRSHQRLHVSHKLPAAKLLPVAP